MRQPRVPLRQFSLHDLGVTNDEAGGSTKSDPRPPLKKKPLKSGSLFAQGLGVSNDEAESYIASYFKQYPGIAAYMARTKESAYRTGYVETLFGRRCHLANIQVGTSSFQISFTRTSWSRLAPQVPSRLPARQTWETESLAWIHTRRKEKPLTTGGSSAGEGEDFSLRGGFSACMGEPSEEVS